MNRHYYISDNLDELERLEAELEASGIATEQIHVLSEKDAETGQRHLHEVSPFMKKDVVRPAVSACWSASSWPSSQWPSPMPAAGRKPPPAGFR